jgi:hypothetical protein
MSLIGTAIGALVALLPRPKAVILTWMCKKCGWMNDNNNGPCRKCGAPQAQADSEVERLRTEVERLTRSHARLLDHIETLEREFLIEQHISTHWKAEAERLAKHSVALRQRAEAQEQQALMMRQYQGLQPTPRWAEMNGRSAMAYAQAQQNLANQQQFAAMGQAQTQQQAFGGFCNCVPSRAQVWGKQAQADAAAERLARLRP